MEIATTDDADSSSVANAAEDNNKKSVANNSRGSTGRAKDTIEIDDEDEDEDDDEKDEEEEEEEEEGVVGGSSEVKSNRGRSVTLKMLMDEGILEAEDGVLVIDYLGKKFVGDLLPNSDIRWQENREIFSSPSAWATHCKKLLNPNKKSGCGWASVKYKGKKLDMYKTLYLMMHNKIATDSLEKLTNFQEELIQNETRKRVKDTTMEGKKNEIICNYSKLEKNAARRTVLKHSTLGNRSSERDPNTLIECTPFCALGKIQPFTVTITTNCLFLMDFHCHLTTSEVVGYLAGHWDVNLHNLAIQQAFPCKCRLGDKEKAPHVEEEIHQNMEKRQLCLVGWYHSHPVAPVHPTLRDIDCQMDYQIKLKGNSDACYTPCVGVICSPYEKDCTSLESSIQAYWVMPPPENKPHEYGKPMLMTFSLIQENFLTKDVKEEMAELVEFYKGAPDFISFEKNWKDAVTYFEKLQKSLSQKAPLEHMETSVNEMIHSLLQASEVNSDITEAMETSVEKENI